MKKTTKKKTPVPAPVTARKVERRSKARRRRARVAAVGLDANTAAVIAGSLGQALGGLSLNPGARLAINIGPHGSRLDYIKPPREEVPPQNHLTEAFVRGFKAGNHAARAGDFIPPEAPAESA